ncbi:MAG: hypothetical protein V3S31_06190 [Dehalococcoidia bacterium]
MAQQRRKQAGGRSGVTERTVGIHMLHAVKATSTLQFQVRKTKCVDRRDFWKLKAKPPKLRPDEPKVKRGVVRHDYSTLEAVDDIARDFAEVGGVDRIAFSDPVDECRTRMRYSMGINQRRVFARHGAVDRHDDDRDLHDSVSVLVVEASSLNVHHGEFNVGQAYVTHDLVPGGEGSY